MPQKQTEIRLEIEALRRHLAAVQAVNEQVILSFMASIAGLTDNPPEYIRQIMVRVDDALAKAARAAGKADPEAQQAAQDAIAYAGNLSARMILGLTPEKDPQ